LKNLGNDKLLAELISGSRQVSDAGLYAIWVPSDKQAQVHALPYITGGQTVVQWRDVEPAQGVYDFSTIDERMRWFAERDQKATLQVKVLLMKVLLFSFLRLLHWAH